MDFLPKTLGTRPRLAVEVRAEGIVAARAEDAAAMLTAVSSAQVPEGAISPGLKHGNVVDKDALVAALRKALDEVAGRGTERGSKGIRDVSIVVPDSAVRVLFLDFDQLPSKAAEALSVVRFRLKKLLPFDADDAVISYQLMPGNKDMVKVLAVAMPKDVLEEYEGAVLAAGYLPGAVLPSTLAALSGLDETEAPVLVVNACVTAVTTAIVQAGALLLHRSDDMSPGADGEVIVVGQSVTIVDRETSVQEWAQQDPLGPEGWSESVVQVSLVQAIEAESEVAVEAREAAQAVSVAAAYFEDTLRRSPEQLLVAGTLGVEALTSGMEEIRLEGMRVRELLDAGMMQAGAVTARVPRGWLAGVRGALKN